MVTVDRPPGSSHPDYPDTVNPVNCGYVDDVPGGDGEDQDVYVPGPDAPLRYFDGTVIAVYHRTDGSGDK